MSPAAALILEMQIYPIIRNTIPRKAKPMGSEDYMAKSPHSKKVNRMASPTLV